MRSFFRYPGGKTKLSQPIIKKLIEKSSSTSEYREPFFGSGSIGLNFLQTSNVDKIWINDLDLGIAELWTAVIKYPNWLKNKIKNFKPTIESFYNFKNILYYQPANIKRLEFGFMKLAIHQISYSGLGVKSGGPLGGESQKSNYKIDCRWSPKYLCKRVDELNQLFSKIKIKRNSCTHVDFSNILIKKSKENISLIYLDPPYYIKGNDLYQFGFTNEQHLKLSEMLKNTEHKWVLSYDDCREIREMYSWAKIDELEVNYSITKARQKKELLIYKEK